MTLIFHHIGIPITERREGEKYSKTFKMFVSGGELPYRIKYLRFEEDCPLHPILKTTPHVAFIVEDLTLAIDGEELVMAPFEPFDGYKTAAIQKDGIVIELIETHLSEDEIWDDNQHKNSIIYPNDL